MYKDFHIAELVIARFCHDLAGPISAVSNGIEFIQEDNKDIKERALDLLSRSSKECSTRLQFFRHLYGAPKLEGEVSVEFLRSLLLEYLPQGKVELDWPNEHVNGAEIALGQTIGRLILASGLIVLQPLLYGGTISVRIHATDIDKKVIIRGEGRVIKVKPTIIDMIIHPEREYEVNVLNIHADFALKLAQKVKAKLVFTYDEHFNEMVIHYK